VSPQWEDLNARARGLGTHFLTRAALEALSREIDLVGLADALRHAGILTGETSPGPTPAELELGIRRWAAAALRTLARWAGPRAAALPLVFDDEDRRSLRAIFRGAAHRVAPERRLAGLIPTPSLPERALFELARAATPSAASALLSAWRHPAAEALAPIATAEHPDLFRLEAALASATARRAVDAARRAHDRALMAVVREAIDLDNAVTAVALAIDSEDVVPKDAFIADGTRITITVFEEAVATGAPSLAGARLAAALEPGPYAEVFRLGAEVPATLEDEILRLRLRDLGRQARLAPLGPLPLIWFALRLRAQVVDLQRIVWTVSLGAPRSTLTGALATVAR